MEINQKLRELDSIVRWQDQIIDGKKIPNNERTRIVAGLIDLALEHEKSIGKLCDAGFYGSAFTLARPLFESYIRALWIRYCASDDELEAFKKGKINKNFGELIVDVEKIKGYDVAVLSDIKNQSWKIMNDFTHGGMLQVQGRNSFDEIKPNYPKENIIGTIDFSISVGLLCTMEVANIIQNESLAHEILKKMENFSKEDSNKSLKNETPQSGAS